MQPFWFHFPTLKGIPQNFLPPLPNPSPFSHTDMRLFFYFLNPFQLKKNINLKKFFQ